MVGIRWAYMRGFGAGVNGGVHLEHEGIRLRAIRWRGRITFRGIIFSGMEGGTWAYAQPVMMSYLEKVRGGISCV